ncbi:MAG TPA: hypothetical protein VJN94_13170 [Candidatus Binataceae bacterium]|nr:hypothetical protein [Candidatus Binataceae bacterium]
MSIDSGTVQNLNGHVAINEAAGAGNQESNAAVVTTAVGALNISQQSTGNVGIRTTTGSTKIGDNAFAGSTGVIQVTQAGGVGNMLANAAFVGLDGPTGSMGPLSLSQVSNAPMPQSNANTTYHEQTGIASTAFSGVNGVVQADQAAGNNNIAANALSVHFEPGTIH